MHLTRRSFLKNSGLLAAASVVPSWAFAAHPAQVRQIGTIGAGHVGGTLGKLWLQAGYKVMFSGKDLDTVKSFTKTLGPNALAGTPEQALQFGDVTLLAVPYGALPQIGRDLQSSLRNKTILDACNPYPWRDGAIATEAMQVGVGVESAKLLPSAHVVRGFNSIDAIVVEAQAHRAGQLLGVPLAGDDQASLAMVEEITKAAGFDPVVLGGLTTASRFAPGSSLFEANLTATQIRQQLHLPA